MTIQPIGKEQWSERFACFDCGYGLSQPFILLMNSAMPYEKFKLFQNERPFYQIDIVFPDDREQIERVLTRRLEVNQNWEWGETIDDLKLQNKEHGL